MIDGRDQSSFIRAAIRDGRLLRAGRAERKRQAVRAQTIAQLEHVAGELNEGRIPPGVIVCRRGRRPGFPLK